MARVRHISRLLPDDELSDSDPEVPWSLPDELFAVADDDPSGLPPIFAFSGRTEQELRQLFPGRLPAQVVDVGSPAAGSPTGIENSGEAGSPSMRCRESPRDP
jgi:hypothetical protein